MTSIYYTDSKYYLDFSNRKPIEVLKYPDQASKVIFGVSPTNIIQTSSQTIELIKNKKITIQMAIHLIQIFSKIRPKKIQLFAELYQNISNEFSHFIKPKNKKLAALLYYRGFRFESYEPEIEEEKIINLYPIESPFYYIAWDKIDDLKNKFPNLEINTRASDGLSPLDCAIKYGSELCFNFLKNIGAKYSRESSSYAVMGGNEYIFSQMIEDGESFDNMIYTALNYHNFEIAEYLQTNLGQFPESIAHSFLYGNYDVASHILYQGGSSRDYRIIFLFTLIIALSNYHYFHKHHQFI
ncbi:hypothetical protein TVAG_062370 [Trichomonas vaginalis G3]|uniref:DUF3447 domain-containing protein n=1 Tax=Trichomonas vaginalis (strain ATCC PRA-98 / G3) TaxID=412133 RepID=A2DLJ9_TRIV3|nr:spectrin binding [Trichomonas vaginalis G3]EAY18632.1 hypothetical protein TVAG_062370 [Trichomonas vaginalis G3]KAI5522508.1 spectrin binding [Trichomonas vaginalis G3]|eukprot:XP_001579618.1 hypothetical protein [Trichomonas vaginalis G3]